MLSFKEFLMVEEKLKDYDGGIDISDKKLKEIPKEYRYNRVEGDFYCEDNQLNSLEGSPMEVIGGFTCGHNQLTSLNGIPKKIEGDFYCEDNPDLFEVSPILNSEIEGEIYYTENGNDEVSVILNKYKNNPRNLIKMLAELKKINMRFC